MSVLYYSAQGPTWELYVDSLGRVVVVVVCMLESLPPTSVISTSRRLLLKYFPVKTTNQFWLSYLGLRDLGTSIDLRGGNLSLVLRLSLESWDPVLVLARSRPSKLLLLEVRLSLVDLEG